MNVCEKLDGLMRYREALDEEGREVFDILMGCARDVAGSIDYGIRP